MSAVRIRPFFALALVLVFFVLCLAITTALTAGSAETMRESAAAPANFTQQARLASGNAGDNYAGIGVGVSGDTAVVSSDAGVYVYLRSGTTWSQQAVLVPSDGPSGFKFPHAVAIQGDTVVMGCGQATIDGKSNQGAAYVFVRNGASWSEQQRLTASDGAAGDRFGFSSVAISGATIIVGAPTAAVGGAPEQGAAYAYVRNGISWTQQAKLLANDGGARNNFGHLVTISGDTAVVTRTMRTTAAIVDPAAYVFVRNGTIWSQQQKLSVCEPSGSSGTNCAFGSFSSGISIAGDTLAVSNPLLNVGNNQTQGGVYVFSRSGTSWTQQQRLTAADGHADNLYGSAVGLSGQTLVVGADADFLSPGAAYVYSWSGTEWLQQQKLEVGPTRNAFGQSLSIDASSLIVASPRDSGSSPNFVGAAYVFTSGSVTPTPTPTPPPNTIQFSTASYNVGEGNGGVTVTVTRTGDVSSSATIAYATSDAGAQNCNVFNGNASSRCDYISALGTLNFVAGETSKTITILIIDDSYAEGSETFNISLNNPSGATLGAQATATVTINDNDTLTGPNPIDQARFFVQQHYYDFLNRYPDQSGWDFWTNEITSCGSDQTCIGLKRINVSAAYFLSIEFQQTGYLVERMYKAAFGNASGASTLGGAHQLPVPMVRFNEFLPDTQQIGQGVVVNVGNWQQQLENNKQAFALDFVQRSRFTSAFATTLTPAQFVDALFTNAGVTPSPGDRQTAINEFGSATNTSDAAARGRALRDVAENSVLQQQEFNRAFVLMQFFGYLRRNPNDPQDTDYTGYEFWLNKLNQFNGNFVSAEMVKAFITSTEYRSRFGP